MINIVGTYLEIRINGNSLPIGAKDIVKFNYSYGLLTTIPVWEVEFMDRGFIMLGAFGSYPVYLEFGNSNTDMIQGDYSIVSRIGVESAEFGGMSTGTSNFRCNHTKFLPYFQKSIPKAFSLKIDPLNSNNNEALDKILKEYGISIDFKIKKITRDIKVYKGVESLFQFLFNLSLYVTDEKDTMGAALYFNHNAEGFVKIFLQNIRLLNFVPCGAINMIASSKNSYMVLDAHYINTLREDVLQNGLYFKEWGVDVISSESVVVGDKNWFKDVPIIAKHLEDISSKFDSYRSVSVGFLSDIEEQFAENYIDNVSFWNKIKAFMVEIVIPTAVFNDLEPGTLIRVFQCIAGVDGVYVILQKAFILSGESGFYTKLWIVNLKEYTK